MAILGVGVDTIDIRRILKSYERFGERLLQKILTPEEIEYCKSRKRFYVHIASRFSAKEAVYKALGRYLHFGIRWKEIEVVREKGGPPEVRLKGSTEIAAREGGIKKIHLSITHDKNLCITFAIAEG